VVPKKHYENIHDIPNDELAHVMATVKRVADNYPVVRILQNNGKPLQEVFHLHFHVLPGGGNWIKK
jgi:histidine triad (HIT) family protein